MTTVCLDIRPIQSAHISRGIGKYTVRLLEEAARNFRIGFDFIYLIQKNLPFELPNLDKKLFKLIEIDHHGNPNWLADQLLLPSLLKTNRVNLFHSLAPLTTIPWITLPLGLGIKMVATIHDINLIDLSGKNEHIRKYVKSTGYQLQLMALRHVNRVIVHSNYVKHKLIDQLKLDTHLVDVIYLSSPIHLTSNDLSKSPTVDSNTRPEYVLFVGEGIIKNLSTCLHSMKFIDPKISLYVIGREETYTREIGSFSDFGAIKNRVRFLGKVPEKQLVSLYRNAICLLYPSYSEGFGFPALEAMQLGCPVICSNVSSLPEITQGAAILVNPDAHAEISKAVNRLYRNKEMRATYVGLGYKRSSTFGWANTWKEHIDVYQSVINE